MTPRVFTIPPSVRFLSALIEALAAGTLVPGFVPDALGFADATIFLPTRRGCRLARDAFLDVLKVPAALLPRIMPIGDLDEDELIFAEAATGGAATDALALPPAIDGLERRLLLTRLVMKWADQLEPLAGEPHLVARHPAAAMGLADDLARLMDDMSTREVPWDRLDDLVEKEFDPYWQITLRFLAVARETWPDLLKERGAIEPAARRDHLIAAEAARLAGTNAPVIAAGSTGSMPATAKLIATIAALPHGAVVLPGLDTELEEEAWNAVAAAPGHPQFAMHALLQRIGISRRDVAILRPATTRKLRAFFSPPPCGEGSGVGVGQAGASVPLLPGPPPRPSPEGAEGAEPLPPGPVGREILVSEALRPAAATDRWRERLAAPRFQHAVSQAMAGITVIAAANAEEEARTIAVVLREALTEPDRVAALVTPDRRLARRVAVMLQRWNISADDSGGDALAETAAGVFASLVAEVALGGFAPASVLALVKHPLARFDSDEIRHARAVSTLERAVLRGPRPRGGSAGLASALAAVRRELAKLHSGEPSGIHRSDPRARLREEALGAAQDLVARISAALAPLEALAGPPSPPSPATVIASGAPAAAKQSSVPAANSGLLRRGYPEKSLCDFSGTRQVAPRNDASGGGLGGGFAEFLSCHRDAVMAASQDRDGEPVALAGPDGEALASAFEEICAKLGGEPFAVAAEDYEELFRAAIGDRVVRRHGAPGSRVRIYGPLEARLTGLDRVVIGGLVETVWPPDSHPDAWLSRPMRHNLGLDLPERRIGLAAHDFAQLLGSPEVFLSIAGKRGGAPTVPSRFVQRLEAVAGDTLWQQALARGEHYRALARCLDEPTAPPRPVKRPEPRPPREARPNSLSVTEIEHWLRDPYTIYAKHILELPQFDPIDRPPGGAERGSFIHGAIGDFAKLCADGVPADAYTELLRLGRMHFIALEDVPEARAFWWPRFERIARWYASFERRRRVGLAAVFAEIRGEVAIPTPSGGFRLTGRADRIERFTGGGYAILDFKTGALPTDKQVRTSIAPQLPLEAAMLRGGGFPDVAPGSIAELIYVRLKGGEPAGEERVIDFNGRNPDAAADEAMAKLTVLVLRFDDPATPYRSLVLPMWKERYGTYDDLARVKEWSLGAEGDEE